ncbi:HprK-related kinase A [Sphingomonas radiodurans]|uniref:HprK-related kinase A n=1 Tax=Sphingomonas radiodurans TaxID=2890321 RepID=UPI001E4B6EEA|nr:HprK-related kinase A [Sphingomonas radiodurans]WBH16854.1 HprK-related kinase A [Sphingomonas radiodurans]
MRHVFSIRVGPIGFRVGSEWQAPIDQLRALYRDYPVLDRVPDFTVRLTASRPWRRWTRPSVSIGGDYVIPDAAPLPLAQGLLAAEMAMNLQMALGQRRFLLLHAAAVERDGLAIILTGESGAGKSTLAALLQPRGWRLLADEFVLIDPATGLVYPFPRPVSLKNAAIVAAHAALPGATFGPLLPGTPKGDIRHLVPDRAALSAMDEPARPILLLFPSFGHAAEQRPVGAGEAFVRLTQASTNYVGLGERGFVALTRLVSDVTRAAIDYPDTATAASMIEELW